MPHRKSRIPVALSLVFTAASVLSGCSLAGRGEDSSLYIDLSSLKGPGSRHALLNSNGPLYGLGTPPTTSSGFSCYAVNVMGPGIPDSSPHAGGNAGLTFDHLMNVPNTYCAYRGIVSPPINLYAGSAQASLQVPPGGVRLVQVVGVDDPLVCTSGVIGNETTPNGGVSRYFEVGRAVLNNLFEDRSVEVTTNWPSGANDDAARAARSVDCGDGSCGNISAVSTGGSPSVFTVSTSGVSGEKVAFRIPTEPGKYIRKVSLLLQAQTFLAGPTVNATIEIYSGSPNTGIGTMTPSGYYSQMDLVPTATAELASFGLENPINHFLQMVSGQEYWIVLSSSDATNITNYLRLNLIQNPSGTASSDVYTFSGSSWIAALTTGIVHEVYGCGM